MFSVRKIANFSSPNFQRTKSFASRIICSNANTLRSPVARFYVGLMLRLISRCKSENTLANQASKKEKGKIPKKK
jgi:hypothetical protein